jgi:hypothetical protein
MNAIDSVSYKHEGDPAPTRRLRSRRRWHTAAIFVQVLAVLVLAAGTWGSARAGSKGVHSLDMGTTIDLGKQGLSVTNVPTGAAYVYMDLLSKGLPPRFGHDAGISFRPPAMEVRFLNANGGRVDTISALVYVFFNIGKAERQLWFESGTTKISIWYANETTGRWQECPTFFINENRDNGMFDRLACLAPGSGFYVLGHVDFDIELFNPYNESNFDVVDFANKYIPY